MSRLGATVTQCAGEIALQLGDTVRFGSVEFRAELASTTDILEQLIDTPPKSVSDTSDTASSFNSDLLTLNAQIQNLRAELAQSMTGCSVNRSHGERPVSPPQVPAEFESLLTRVGELERLAVDARQQSQLARQELESARGEWNLRTAEWSVAQAAWDQERVQIETKAANDRQRDLTLISELSREAEMLRLSTHLPRKELSAVQSELQTVRADAARLTQTWEHAATAWIEEREQRQFERDELLTTQQRLTTELERRHAERGELLAAQQELTAELGQRQAEWSRELQQLLKDVERLESEGGQTTSAAVQREQDLAQQTEQIQGERQALKAQAESLKVERQAIDRERDNLELVKANQAREKLVLAHSWEWLQSDRRSFVAENDRFVDEKKQWQQQQHAEQEEWQTEKAQWEQARQQADAECREAAPESESARVTLQAQQQALAEEWARLEATAHELEVFRAETDSLVASLERDRQAIESERQIFAAELQSLAAEWEAKSESESTHATIQVEKQTLTDEWARLQASAHELQAFRAETDSLVASLERDRQVLESERQVFAAELQSLTAEWEAKSELESTDATIQAEKQALAEEWARLQTSSHELEVFRAETDSLVASLERGRQAIEVERLLLATERQSLAAGWEAESESARANIQAQQKTLTDEWARLQTATDELELFRAETDSHVASLERDRQAIEVERQLLATERQSVAAEWEAESESTRANIQTQQQSLTEEWARLQTSMDDLELFRAETELLVASLERDRQTIESERQLLATERQSVVAEWEAESESTRAKIQAQQQALTEEWARLQASTHELESFRTETDSLVASLERDREAIEVERQLLATERQSVAAEREAESESTRAKIQAQQQALTEEWAHLQTSMDELELFRAETDSLVASLERDRQVIEVERQLLATERQSAADEWEAVTTTKQSLAAERKSLETARLAADREARDPTAAELPNVPPVATPVTHRVAIVPDEMRAAELDDWTVKKQATGDWDQEAIAGNVDVSKTLAVAEDVAGKMPLDEPWTNGVDLTHPFQEKSATRACEPSYQKPVDGWSICESPVTDDASSSQQFPAALMIQELDSVSPPTRRWTRPLTEATSLAVFHPTNDASLTTPWTAVSSSSLSDFVFSAADAISTECSSTETEPVSATTATTDADPQTAELRADLAHMFDLPALTQKSSADAHRTADPYASTINSQLVVNDDSATDSRVSAQNDDSVDVSDVESSAKVVPAEVDAAPNTILEEPLSFSDDQSIDDSVTQYMQRLMGRTRGWSGQEAPDTSVASSEPSTSSHEMTNSLPAQTDVAKSPPNMSFEPAHKQDKTALRTATEQMRQVAHLQTIKNVEIANWSKLKSSIKAKSALALFAFVLSVGLLFLGYRIKPQFLTLGGCAVCIGVLTWVDLFLAIHKARILTKQLDAQRSRKQA